MNRLTTLSLLLALAPATPVAEGARSSAVKQVSNSSGVDIIIVAHEDDWQVFMGDAIVDRIRSGRRPVFIYLTAGDDGRDSVYWRQREKAALQSSRVALALPVSVNVSCDTAHLESRAIRRCVLGSSVSYFLRLPDGNRSGAGFAQNRFESLRKLRTKGLRVDAIDSSETYASWQDLTTTVNSLVRIVVDSTRFDDVVLHTTDPSVRANPHDHYDHRMAGKLTESLLKTNRCSGRYYVGYALATRSANRTTKQRQEKLEVFEAYDREMMRINQSWGAYRERPTFYSESILRTYARAVRARQTPSHK